MLWGFLLQMYGALEDADKTFASASQRGRLCRAPHPCAGGMAAIGQLLREPSILPERVRNDARTIALARQLQAAM